MRAAARVAEIDDSELADVVVNYAAHAMAPDRGRSGPGDSELTSWAASQAVLALLERPQLLPDLAKPSRLLRKLLHEQDGDSGGWLLRPGESGEQTPFAFYPTLALARWAKISGIDETLDGALAAARSFHVRAAHDDDLHLEHRLLSIAALRAVERVLPSADAEERRREAELAVMDGATREGRLGLQDRSVLARPHPLWYFELWHPLLYLARRAACSPFERTQAWLSHSLITAFDPSLGGWRGPFGDAASAITWATGLGLHATHALASDLDAAGLSVPEWLARVEEIRTGSHDFDVAISVAGPDRHVAEEIRTRLAEAGLRVFYDRDHEHALLGENLTEALHPVFFKRSRFAVAVLSAAFTASDFSGNLEWRAIQARMTRQRHAYVLLYMLEPVHVPGLNPDVAYVSAERCTPAQFADLVIRKLRSPA